MPNNLLVISDDVRSVSGVANQSREVITALTSAGHNVYHIGHTTMQPPQLVSDVTLENGKTITVYSSPQFDDINLILSLIQKKNIHGLILVTDPHRYEQVWQNVRVIRSKCPIIYYAVWDTDLIPAKDGKRHYNQFVYESCDTVAAISKQTENFVRNITATLPVKPYIVHVPHGQNANVFKPIPEAELAEMKKNLFRNQTFDFTVMLNSRNQGRKRIPDLILAFKQFTESLTPEQADKCALLLHTELSSPNGTDLMETCMALAPSCHIFLNSQPFTQQDLAKMYNCADVVAAVSNAEGFGLSINEAMLCGVPVMATVTGGLQDQMGFLDDGGELVKFDRDFTSNATGRYRTHGTWAYPIFPTARNIIGSPVTPYLFDDNASIEAIQAGLVYWYVAGQQERKRRGAKGREYCLKNGYNSDALGKTFLEVVNKTIAEFKKQNTFTIYE